MLTIVFSVFNKRCVIETSGQHTDIKNSIKKIVTEILKENGKGNQKNQFPHNPRRRFEIKISICIFFLRSLIM